MRLSPVFLFITALLSSGASAFERGDADQCVPLSKWKEVSTSNILDSSAAIQTLSTRQVILLGEDHDSAEHHRWQLDTLSKLHVLQPKMAIGFEMFPRRVQPVLDQWIAGKLTQAEFLDKVEWERVWSYRAEDYMPMLHYARMHQIPIIALNVERTLISQVGDKGWENVPEKDREGVGKPAPASDMYVELLAEIYSQHIPKNHGHGNGDDKDVKVDMAMIKNRPGFKRFVQGQQLWDRAMAEKIHTVLQHEDVSLVVGVMGAGHIMSGAAVPFQLVDLGMKQEQVASLMPWDGVMECEQLQSGVADYAYGLMQFVEPVKEEETPKLGIYLEPAEDGVAVVKLVEGSIAEKLGVKPDDIITRMAGKPVTKVNDVIKLVRNTAWGTWLPFSVKRVKKEIDFVAKIPPR